MSIIDKVIAAITPPVSDETREKARAEAMSRASPDDWLTLVIAHHEELEARFAAVKAAANASDRIAAQKALALLLTGHVVAEENVLYPALALDKHKVHAELGYNEQAAVKIQMHALEKLAPMSQDYLDKLEHIRGAVVFHMYQEESSWFLDLNKDLPASEQLKLTQRYREEFEQYVGAKP
ncbi:MAG: hemerythrin domain-containing protein [Comamonadaceae bacterium]|nr:MAG: hemerythrin domain-containing protein [Comamonadaceae bacterium]